MSLPKMNLKSIEYFRIKMVKKAQQIRFSKATSNMVISIFDNSKRITGS